MNQSNNVNKCYDTSKSKILFFLDESYPKRITEKEEQVETNLEMQVNMLEEIFPDADSAYLRMQAEKYSKKHEGMQHFIAEALELRDYPTKKEALRRAKMSSQIKQYTQEFDSEKFLEIIPDPTNYFKKSYAQIGDKSYDKYYVNMFLRNNFCTLLVSHIANTFKSNEYNVINTWKCLKQTADQLKSKRKKVALPTPPENIPLLQELAFLEHFTEVQNAIKEKELRCLKEIETCKELGLMKTCNCCYDEEVLPNNIITCLAECQFCKSCVERSVEIAFGEGKIDFPCLKECISEFSIQTLQVSLCFTLKKTK